MIVCNAVLLGAFEVLDCAEETETERPRYHDRFQEQYPGIALENLYSAVYPDQSEMQ